MVKKKDIRLLLYGISLLLFAAAVWLSHTNGKRIRPERIHPYLQARFEAKERQMDGYADSVIGQRLTDIPRLLAFCERHDIENSEFAFYVYEGSELKAWSSNIVNLPNKLNPRTLGISGYHVFGKNKTYVRQYVHEKERIFCIYVLESPYGLPRPFCRIGSNMADGNAIRIQPASDTYPILNRQGEAAFSLEMSDPVPESDSMAFVECLLWMIACTMLMVTIRHRLRQTPFFRKRPNSLCGLLILLSVGMLCFFLYSGFPASMHTSKLFSSLYYTSAFRSLGGLLMGSYTLLALMVAWVKDVRWPKKLRTSWFCFVRLTVAHLLYIITFVCFYRMMLNASFNTLPTLPIWNPMLGDGNTLLIKLLFTFSLTALLCVVQLVLENSYRYSFSLRLKKRKINRICLLSALLAAAAYLLFILPVPEREHHLFWLTGLLFFAGIVGVNIVHVNLPQERFSLRYQTISCLISIMLLSFLLEDANHERLQLSQESFASSLLEKEDPLMLYNLREVSRMMDEDETMKQLLSDTNVWKTDLMEYLQEQYILPYFENYRQTLSVGRGSIPTDHGNIQHLRRIFRSGSPDSQCPDLAMLNKPQLGSPPYLLMKAMACKDKRQKDDTVYIAMEITGGSDFFKPNYLLNRNEHRLETEIPRLSCAEYENGELISSMDMNNLFYLNMRNYGLDTLYNGMLFKRGHVHYHVYFRKPDHLILLASTQTPFRRSLAICTYLFLFAIVPFTLIQLLVHFRQRKRFLMFKQRVQLLIVGLILLTSLTGCVLFSIFTLTFSQLELDQSSSERSNMMLNMLPSENLSPDSATTTYLDSKLVPSLYRIAKKYVENANIYTLQGEAVIALDKSLPILQNPVRLNPKVIEEINYRKKAFYRDTDIGHVRNQAHILYKPIRNRKGEMVAYFSFPSQQKGGYMEYLLSSILPLFLCIYLIINIFFAFFGSLTGKYLLASLSHIAAHLSKVKLQSKNRKIQWKYQDEIGLLVTDYNRLIDDLEVSAERLARTERESAWKELAQQVAHEIKNPLTPMRLRTQQLQRHIQEGSCTDEQLKKYTEMMIGQIDALTDITSSFASLAKIHQGNAAAQPLLEIMRNALDMYENSPDCRFELHPSPDAEQAVVWIEREQLLRVFNNLIKNAIQAKKDGVPQRIVLKLAHAENEPFWCVEITDYGKGMDKEEKSHAFTPHFTTKSTGSGLGLAIVKNILSDWGGDIRFESLQGAYTSFFFRLPEYRP
ncbi:MAG: HAMP domain-containing histidine kinase [Bacteroidales bacterium]|nr:HAMP domain-containing histidine kinase [Bacteroidales bacterium]